MVDGTLHPLRHPLTYHVQARRRPTEPLCDDRLRGWAGEGWLAREHLINYAGQRVDVASSIEVTLPCCLLGLM